jgi:hypothetical protein
MTRSGDLISLRQWVRSVECEPHALPPLVRDKRIVIERMASCKADGAAAKQCRLMLSPASRFLLSRWNSRCRKLRAYCMVGFDDRTWQMPISENARSAAAIHRKLRALGAVFSDPAATEHEKANAERLKGRLEKQLGQEPTPDGATGVWTGIMFRLGKGVKEITSSPSQKGDWTDHAFRLGRMLRNGFKR